MPCLSYMFGSRCPGQRPIPSLRPHRSLRSQQRQSAREASRRSDTSASERCSHAISTQLKRRQCAAHCRQNQEKSDASSLALHLLVMPHTRRRLDFASRHRCALAERERTACTRPTYRVDVGTRGAGPSQRLRLFSPRIASSIGGTSRARGRGSVLMTRTIGRHVVAEI